MELIGKQKLESDKLLMEQVARGNRDAQNELLVALWRRVTRMARYMSPYKQEAEDLAQEVLLEILKSAKGFKADGCLEAWADVIAVRTILRRLRKHHRMRRLLVLSKSESEEIDYLELAEADCDQENELVVKEKLAELMRVLGKLNPEQRTVLVLKLIYGHSVDEIAEMMEKRPQSIKYLLQKGRTKLRRLVLQDASLRELLSGRM